MAKHLNINDAARAFMKETFVDASSKPYSSDLATTMTQIAELYEEGLTEEQKASIPTGGDYNALADAFYRMVKTMSLSGGAGGVFVINATYDREEDGIDWYTIDKTPAEIKAAWDAGMMPVLIYEGTVNQLVKYDVSDDFFNFDFHRIAVSGGSILEIKFHIYSNGGTDVGCNIIAYENGGDSGVT